MTRWLVMAVAAMAITMSCFIDRRASDFACQIDADCDDLPGAMHECTNHVCVVLDCPALCDSCVGNQCMINCNNASKCAGLDCPNNFTCAFSCTQDCKNLECDDGCTVACAGNADCGPIDCGAGAVCNCTATGNGTCL